MLPPPPGAAQDDFDRLQPVSPAVCSIRRTRRGPKPALSMADLPSN